jgi:rhodanese-related sulfurtransferase
MILMTIRITGIRFCTFAVILIAVFTAGCGKGSKRNQVRKEEAAVSVASPVIGTESLLLLKELEENGDYVNSREYPSLIKASIVNEEIGGKNLVIDIRSSGEYSSGHIKGSVNRKFEDLPSYFESGIKPFEYDKIIIVCADGQLSCYTTALLRLKGYGNVYALRWGMSGWNRKYAEEGWLKGLSGKYEPMLDTVTHMKPAAAAMPLLSTGKTDGASIADSRFSVLFSEGTGRLLISADEVFSNPSGFFIINLERKDKYESGHIPGAIRYKPDATLGFTSEMATIPAGRTVVLYCGTGHNSAFATAYLRLFGYDAKTLKYGNNSFMHDRMIIQKTALSWLPFSDADINDFQVVR